MRRKFTLQLATPTAAQIRYLKELHKAFPPMQAWLIETFYKRHNEVT